MATRFDHEKLDVYQEAISFVAWADDITQSMTGKCSVKDQLDRASTSVPLNIAEGNAKRSIRDRCRYLDTACGSALECAACLDVIVAKGLLRADDVECGKGKLQRIVSMLVRLIESTANRVGEGRAEYEYEYDYE